MVDVHELLGDRADIGFWQVGTTEGKCTKKVSECAVTSEQSGFS